MWPIFAGRLAVPLGMLAAGLLVGGYAAWSLTADHYQGVIAKGEAERAALVNQKQAEVIAAQQTQAKITNEVANEYEHKLTDLRGRYADALERVREQTRGDRGPVCGVPDATGGNHAAPGNNRLSERAGKRLVELMRDADEQTARLVACQTWVSEQTK